MPFVEKSHRDNPDFSIPGDRTYVYYRLLVDKWKVSPRWTTFDKMTIKLFPDDNKRAYFLALLVFFEKYIKDYERKKEAENGPIE